MRQGKDGMDDGADRRHVYAGVILGRFVVRNAGPGKVLIHLYGDGEGGEFSEAELAEVVGRFYGEKF